MKLSQNFNLSEYLASPTATANGITEQFTPPQGVIDNIVKLNGFVQQARTEMNRPFRITSGYRCERLNRRVRGVANSEHITGEGVDIAFNSIDDAVKMAEIFIKLGIKRIGLGWSFLHVGISPRHPNPAVFVYGKTSPALLKHRERLRRLM